MVADFIRRDKLDDPEGYAVDLIVILTESAAGVAGKLVSEQAVALAPEASTHETTSESSTSVSIDDVTDEVASKPSELPPHPNIKKFNTAHSNNNFFIF